LTKGINACANEDSATLENTQACMEKQKSQDEDEGDVRKIFKAEVERRKNQVKQLINACENCGAIKKEEEKIILEEEEDEIKFYPNLSDSEFKKVMEKLAKKEEKELDDVTTYANLIRRSVYGIKLNEEETSSKEELAKKLGDEDEFFKKIGVEYEKVIPGANNYDGIKVPSYAEMGKCITDLKTHDEYRAYTPLHGLLTKKNAEIIALEGKVKKEVEKCAGKEPNEWFNKKVCLHEVKQ
jgi:hypothetical protein